MKRWAVTGPIGSGKSTLTRLLIDWGAAVLDGDRLGHEILTRPNIVAGVKETFGPEMVPAGVVDRSRLGQRVFADPGAMSQLNGLTHGPLAALIRERLDELADEGKHGLAVLEAAVYFLLPDPPPMDLVVCVTAPEDQRLARLARRNGLTEAEALRRMRIQDPMAGLWSRADVVIANDGLPGALTPIARDLWDRFGPCA